MKQKLIKEIKKCAILDDHKMKIVFLDDVVGIIEEFFNQNGSLELSVGGTPIKQEYININK